MSSAKASSARRTKTPKKKAPPRAAELASESRPDEESVDEASADAASNEERDASVGDLVAALGDDEAPKGRKKKRRDAANRGDVPSEPAGEEAPEDDAEASPEQDAEPEPERPAKRADGVQLADSIPIDPDDDLSKVEGEPSPRLMSIVESILFASNKPMSVRDLRRLLDAPSVRQIQLALKGLMLDTQDRGVVLSQVAGGFRLRTNPDNARWVQRMIAGRPVRLSRSQLEALAVIAYRQPITKAEVDHVRGVDCGAVLKVLLERDLIKYVGRKDEAGRPHLYGTTVRFLEFFNLRSLRDMPSLQEFEELTEESEATLRETLGHEEPDGADQELFGQEPLDFGAPQSGETPQEEGAGGAAPSAEETDAPEPPQDGGDDDAPGESDDAFDDDDDPWRGTTWARGAPAESGEDDDDDVDPGFLLLEPDEADDGQEDASDEGAPSETFGLDDDERAFGIGEGPGSFFLDEGAVEEEGFDVEDGPGVSFTIGDASAPSPKGDRTGPDAVEAADEDDPFAPEDREAAHSTDDESPEGS